tara:strand:- start:420 stop:563 length:144 start_codon:yes stop_codon:yes gene_type:complete
MIALLIAIRNFCVAVLIGWLGLVAEPADKQAQKETAPSVTASIAMIR